MRPLIYVSSPYTAGSSELVAANVERACAYGAQVRSVGAVPLVPHSAVLPFPAMTIQDAWGPAMAECLRMLEPCDAILMCPGWERSRGCRVEHSQAISWGIRVVYSVAEVRAMVEAVA